MTSGLAKVILLGEHAVVHGHPALAGAIDRRVSCRIAGPDESLRLVAQNWGLDVAVTDDHPVALALHCISDAVGFRGRVLIEAKSSVPAAAGLGSSAALCVALTRCLAEGVAVDLATDDLERIANLGERAFHDNPSGVDVALAARGGIGVFRKASGFERLATAPLEIAIAHSGEDRSTAAMVRGVADRLASVKGTADVLARLGALAEKGIDALRAGDSDALGPLFDDAQQHLAALDLSTAKLDTLIELAKTAGATGAKLTGAGGGGSVIATGPALSEVIRAWKGAGYGGFKARVGALP